MNGKRALQRAIGLAIVVLLLAGCGGAQVEPTSTAPSTDKPLPTPGPMMKCELENITVRYRVFGEGRPLLVLHGWPADHLSMVEAFEPIFESREGWKRFYPDLPGMGETPGEDWIKNQDDVLDVVLDFVDSVAPGQNVAIAGYSYGGYLAQGVVYKEPALVEGVFLLAPGYAGTPDCRLPRPIILVEDKALIDELEPIEAIRFQGVVVVQSRKTLEGFIDFSRRAGGLADQQFLSRLGNNWAFSFDVDELPEPFDRPSLILTGRQDSGIGYCNAWSILENYPRATFAVLDRAGHALLAEQEHLFNVLVSEWLDRVEEHAVAME
jgi:pimeloyl-ACP methyl ester carboxylesterase